MVICLFNFHLWDILYFSENICIHTSSRFRCLSILETSSDGLLLCWRRTTPLTDADGSATRNSSSISAKSSFGGLPDEPKRLPTSDQTLRPLPATRPAGIFTHCRRRRRDRGVGVSCSSPVVVAGTPWCTIVRGGGGGGGGRGGGLAVSVFVISSRSDSKLTS